MMNPDHDYQVTAWWTAGKGGMVRSANVPTTIHFTAPVEFGGDPGRWNPEELLLGALASCFTTTFEAIANYSKLSYTDLEVCVVGSIEKIGSGFQFKEIRINPKVRIHTEELRTLASRVVIKTNDLCLVSRAISTPKILTTEITVGTPAASAAAPLIFDH